MRINCENVGKRFHLDWIFKNINVEFKANQAYAITGPNGSGKSTFLQLLAGALIASSGKVSYRVSENEVLLPEGEVFKRVSIAAPYLELIEEMTLSELLHFHEQFKPFLPGIKHKDIMSITGLSQAADKQIRYFSSGMKQRAKLALAVLSDTECLLLDEPCSNFDESGFRLYDELIRHYTMNRLTIVSSNDEKEYEFCTSVLSILDYK
jgi:ABC-type multidrug transport system ATPase subunit